MCYYKCIFTFYISTYCVNLWMIMKNSYLYHIHIYELSFLKQQKCSIHIVIVTNASNANKIKTYYSRSQAKGLSGSPGVGSKLCRDAFFLPLPVPFLRPGVLGESVLRPWNNLITLTQVQFKKSIIKKNCKKNCY